MNYINWLNKGYNKEIFRIRWTRYKDWIKDTINKYIKLDELDTKIE